MAEMRMDAARFPLFSESAHVEGGTRHGAMVSVAVRRAWRPPARESRPDDNPVTLKDGLSTGNI